MITTLDPSLQSAQTFDEFSSFPADLSKDGAGYSRQLRIHGAGTVTLAPVKPRVGGSATVTLTVLDGDVLDAKATSIASVSGVTSVGVFW